MLKKYDIAPHSDAATERKPLEVTPFYPFRSTQTNTNSKHTVHLQRTTFKLTILYISVNRMGIGTKYPLTHNIAG